MGIKSATLTVNLSETYPTHTKKQHSPLSELEKVFNKCLNVQ